MQKHKVSNDDDDDDCLMLLQFLSFFACFLDRFRNGYKEYMYYILLTLVVLEMEAAILELETKQQTHLGEPKQTDRKERETRQIVIRFIFFLLNPKP
jgi:hypothetical protein